MATKKAKTETQKTQTQEPKVVELEGGLKLKNLNPTDQATFNQCKALMKETGILQRYWNNDSSITVAKANELISGLRDGSLDATQVKPEGYTPPKKSSKKTSKKTSTKSTTALESKIDLLAEQNATIAKALLALVEKMS